MIKTTKKQFFENLACNKNKRKLNAMCRINRDCIKVSSANTFVHETAKFIVGYYLNRIGHSFVSEAIFLNGKRADLYVLNTDTVIEIQCSKNKKLIEEKKHIYPVNRVIILDPIEVIGVDIDKMKWYL